MQDEHFLFRTEKCSFSLLSWKYFEIDRTISKVNSKISTIKGYSRPNSTMFNHTLVETKCIFIIWCLPKSWRFLCPQKNKYPLNHSGYITVSFSYQIWMYWYWMIEINCVFYIFFKLTGWQAPKHTLMLHWNLMLSLLGNLKALKLEVKLCVSGL